MYCRETAGANRVLTLDLHAAQIQGFFDIPVDHLFAMPVMIEYFRSQDIPKLTVVSPDAGGVERARAQTDELFQFLQPEAIYDRPIPERHRLVFYFGHLEAFDWNQICRGTLGMQSFHASFEVLSIETSPVS